MINTFNSAEPHYTKGFFTVGNGPTVVLLLGACRVLPYVNYLDYLNAQNRFTIHLINLVNFHFNKAGEKANPPDQLLPYEQNHDLLAMLGKVKWFMHEFTTNFGMLNTDMSRPKNIYQFGLRPQHDISLPNFNNVFILFQELVQFNERLRDLARADMKAGKDLSAATKAEFKAEGMMRIEKFLETCRKTALPEMADLLERTWRTTRYWWTGSHISNAFSIAVFKMMNDKFLHLNPTPAFWAQIAGEDMYCSPASPITRYDVEAYGLQWPEPLQELAL